MEFCTFLWNQSIKKFEKDEERRHKRIKGKDRENGDRGEGQHTKDKWREREGDSQKGTNREGTTEG
jgi:hypothetical protein